MLQILRKGISEQTRVFHDILTHVLKENKKNIKRMCTRYK